MKIDMQTNLNVYRKKVGAEYAAAPAGQASASTKKDIVDFSHGSTATDKALVGTKASIQSYLAAPTNAGRLDALRADIKNGSYHVDTEDLVNAIIGDERVI